MWLAEYVCIIILEKWLHQNGLCENNNPSDSLKTFFWETLFFFYSCRRNISHISISLTGIFQQNNTVYHIARVVQEWFQKHEDHTVLIWPQISIPLSTYWMRLDVLD